MFSTTRAFAFRFATGAALAVALALPVSAQVTAHKQAIAEMASEDRDVAAFYRAQVYAPIWTGTGAAFEARRMALFDALRGAPAHGLAASRYDIDGLIAQMRAARSTRALGEIEVELSRAFLKYARDVQTGMLVPSSIDSGIVRTVPYRDRAALLTEFSRSDDPVAFMRALPPQTHEYAALRKEKLRLEARIAQGGWGPTVPSGKLEPGDSGTRVIALRDRLQAMGYLGRSATATYDKAMEEAVRSFQMSHGLEVDGVAGDGTISELNVSPEARMRSILVAMERERWFNRERGPRHVLVNLADFHAKIIDDDRIVFQTRSVVGHRDSDRRSPEFSDVMEHMIINPSWNVPRSIITKEYLPVLQKNPNAVSHLLITDSRGRAVDRGAVDFTQFSSRSFPFDMRQPPGPSNAMGLVKFMFPNKHNIYLHDTPQKHLFSREVRAYSHGCIRLADPFEFAYALLSEQTDDPVGLFHRTLDTGRETKVDLRDPLPVHLIYRTAISKPKGGMEYRRDVYGRDAKIWSALEQAGVALNGIQG